MVGLIDHGFVAFCRILDFGLLESRRELHRVVVYVDGLLLLTLSLCLGEDGTVLRDMLDQARVTHILLVCRTRVRLLLVLSLRWVASLATRHLLLLLLVAMRATVRRFMSDLIGT